MREKCGRAVQAHRISRGAVRMGNTVPWESNHSCISNSSQQLASSHTTNTMLRARAHTHAHALRNALAATKPARVSAARLFSNDAGAHDPQGYLNVSAGLPTLARAYIPVLSPRQPDSERGGREGRVCRPQQIRRPQQIHTRDTECVVVMTSPRLS